MKPYDSEQNYFGAEGTLLCKLLGDVLEFAPAIRNGINVAAFNHDVGYTGTKQTGFFGWIKDYFERKRLDRQFFSDMEDTIIAAELLCKITQKEADIAINLADIAYDAVRAGGWTFYRTGVTEND